jgi:hypothetical protein
MIIVRIMGGLGNQMFQYAMGRRLAEHHNTELLLDVNGYGETGEPRPSGLHGFPRPLRLPQLAVTAKAATQADIARLRDSFSTSSTRDRLVRRLRRVKADFLWNASHIIERHYRFQPDALSLPDNVYVQGYWQSEKYFQDIAPAIRKEFRPLDSSIADEARRFIEQLRVDGRQVVSLHVRRGDLAYAHETLRRTDVTYGAPLPLDYIERAMTEFPEGTCFVVFSDSPQDIEWCRSHIRTGSVEFSTGKSDLWDLFAMSACDHHIIANSTFSWWAAWLNDRPGRRVIAPRVWSWPDTAAMPIDDLIPPGWQILG